MLLKRVAYLDHLNILFPNAMTDPQEYLQAQTAWLKLFDRIVSETTNDTVWLQWMAGTYGDGTLVRDSGSPIFTRICEGRGKAITIRQYTPGEDWNAEYLLHAFVHPQGEFGEVDTLDLSIVLTEETLAKAEALIRLYVVDDLSPEEMTQRLGNMDPNSDNPTGAERPLALVSLDYGLCKHFAALRGARGACLAGYDAIPSPRFVVNMRMRFSKHDGSNSVRIFAQGTQRDGKLRLSYEIKDTNGDLLAKGPSAAMSVGGDAANDVRIVEDWLDEVDQFASNNLGLIA